MLGMQMSESCGLALRGFAFVWLVGLLGGATVTAMAEGSIPKLPVAEGAWQDPATLAVPGSSEAHQVYWLRCWVKVHDNFFTPHERNLFEESVGIHVKGFVGAHELWVNGQKIGVAGGFPPAYEPAESDLIRHKVPVGTLVPGQWNEVAFRVYQPGPRDGFQVAPFIMNYFYECVMEGDWEFWSGDALVPGPALAQEPVRTTFQQFRDSQEVLGRAEQVRGPSLPPGEAAAALDTVEGLSAELLLHEPVVAQPFQFSFDERGRLWVAQCRQYPYPAGLKMLSRDRYYRSHYDKVPPAPPHHDPGADLISIHEDTDGDGQFDSHKVFVSGLNLANSVVKGDGGVWVMHTPYLLFYPDADGDDVPDGPPQVHLSGFGLEDTHAMANGLVWGPDGWLYGCQGSSTSCRVVRPGIDPADAAGVYFEGCMVWRYEPRTKAFELFAEGGGNTFGLEFDAQGRLYSGHNGAETRGWHFVQGGFYLMQHADPGKFGPPRNPYAFGDLPMMAASHPVVRFSHFGAFVDGAALPSSAAGQLWVLDPLHNEVIAVERQRRGATFLTSDRGVVVKSRDEAFRPVYVANAPDGSLYVADMYEYYIAHGQHYQNQIDTTTGRIYRLKGSGLALETDVNAAAKSVVELEGWLSHPNKWQRWMASRELGRRGDLAGLAGRFNELPAVPALHALWAVYQGQGMTEALWQQALVHEDATVRLWAVRLLGDRYGVQRNLGLPPVDGPGRVAESVPGSVWGVLRDQVERESDVEVRSQMAATARRLNFEQGLAIVDRLMERAEDVDDPFVPLLCWWVFEAHLPAEADGVMAYFSAAERRSRPMVLGQVLPRLARRFAIEGKRVDLLRVAGLLRWAMEAESESERQVAAVMEGFEEAYRGRAMTALPDELLQVLAEVGGGSLLFRMRQGQADAFALALERIEDGAEDLGDRLNLLRGFGELDYPAAVPRLLGVLTSDATPAIRRAVLAALARYDQPEIAVATLELLPQWDEEVRTAGLALLVSRPAWCRQLVAAVSAGDVPSSWLPANLVEQLRADPDVELRRVAEQLYPLQRATTAQVQALIAEVETTLREAAGNPYGGEAIYMERCAACHKLFFKGGNLGPDLTRYQRDNLGTMLISIVNPSAEIREGYELLRVLTADGRILQGFQVDRDNQVLVLRGPDGQDMALALDEIEQMEAAGRSLMPDGLLDGLSPQQIRDLFAYLRISQPFTN